MKLIRRILALFTAVGLILLLAACSEEQAVSPAQTRPSPADGEEAQGTGVPDGRPTASDLPDTAGPEPSADGGDGPRYIFIGGLLLGSFDKDGWYSLCDTGGDYRTGGGNATPFYAKELLAASGYRLWDGEEYVGEADRIVWLTGEDYGLGSFEADGVSASFENYGELFYGYGGEPPMYRAFPLPTALGEELSDLRIHNYGFHTGFIPAGGAEVYASSSLLTLNGEGNPFPRPLTHDAAVTPEGEAALLELFRAAGMTDTPPNFTDCVRGDFDGDGRDELLMAANSPVDEGYWPMVVGEGNAVVERSGTFSILLYQEDDGEVHVLHSDLRPMKEPVTLVNGGYTVMDIDHCHTVRLITAADLNDDGSYELIVMVTLWEGGYTLAYSRDSEGKWQPVLRSNWGT